MARAAGRVGGFVLRAACAAAAAAAAALLGAACGSAVPADELARQSSLPAHTQTAPAATSELGAPPASAPENEGEGELPATGGIPGPPREPHLPKAPPSDDPPPPQGPVPDPPDVAFRADLAGCCSEDRGDAPVDMIVLHTTEFADEDGLGDLRRLATFFRKVRLAAHVAVDAEGNSARYLEDRPMGYHASYWNRPALGIEQMGFGSFSRSDWLARDAELTATARWIAHWARQYRIPIRRCIVDGITYNEKRKRVFGGRTVKRGICSHGQLDPRNRSDPGAGYPWDLVLSRARKFAAQAK